MNDDEKALAIERQGSKAQLNDREAAILAYVEKLTSTPESMKQEDVQRLRLAGLSDAEILDVCQVAAYYNFVNRLAQGLGVELEGYWEEPLPGTRV